MPTAAQATPANLLHAPIVQSIPHGGMESPPDFAARLAIDATDIYNEADLWVDDLYNLAEAAHTVATLASISASIARGIVDVNRPPDDLANPDGAVKANSSYGHATFAPPLDTADKRRLIDTHWHPWHNALAAALASAQGSVKLLLDCHSMAQRGPTTYAYAGAARPHICIANLGDDHGAPRSEGHFAGVLSAPADFLRIAGEAAADLFADLPLLAPDGGSPPIVALNWPFAGGYICWRYSSLANPQTAEQSDTPAQAPWSLMVEVNRGLYVGQQDARTPIAPPNLERIAAVRDRLALWVRALCEYLPK